MELLNKAKWIWHKSTSKMPNQYCQFLADAEFSDICENAKCFISATSDYVLWINGKYVSCRQYHDYPENKSFDTIEIGKYLKKGKNRIAVLGYNMGVDTFAYINDTAGIIFAIENGKETFFSGKDCYVRISPDYKNGEMEKISPQLGWTFEFDANKSDNWTDENYNIGSDWTKISDDEIMPKTYNFFPRPIAKLERLAHTKPEIIVAGSFIRKKSYQSAAETVYNDFLGASVVPAVIPFPNKDFCPEKNEGTDGVYYIIDMGKEVAGNVYLEFTAEKGCILEVGYGEQLDDMRVRSFVGGRNFGFRYFAKEGENKFIHRLLRLGGRYLEIHVTGKAFIKNAEIIPTDYNAPLKSSFDSVNKLENKIHEISVRTLRICMHEHFEDTPWREQGLYGMDSRNQALCNYYAFADYNFVKSCLKTFAGTFSDDGFFEITSPTKFDFTIPSFTFAWIMMIKDYLMYSGDYDFAKEMLPQIKYTLDKVSENIDKTGILPTDYNDRYWNFTEWQPGLSGDHGLTGSAGDYSLPHNAFYALALDSTITIMNNLGEDTQKYQDILAKLRISCDKKFWNAEKSYYKTYEGGLFPEHYSQLVGALAILSGIADDKKADTVRDKIVNDKSLVECTLSMTTYKYEALLGNKKYADFVFEEIENMWGFMITKGATTFWETILGGWDFEKAGSWSHAWSATPLYFYYAYLLGVKPTKPGFEEYTIDPVKKNYIEAKIYTPNGFIEINNK